MDESEKGISPTIPRIDPLLPAGVSFLYDEETGFVTGFNFDSTFNRDLSTISKKHTEVTNKWIETKFPQIPDAVRSEVAIMYSAYFLVHLSLLRTGAESNDWDGGELEKSSHMMTLVDKMQFPSFLARYLSIDLSELHPLFARVNRADVNSSFSVEMDRNADVMSLTIHDSNALKAVATNRAIAEEMEYRLGELSLSDMLDLFTNQKKRNEFIHDFPMLF